MILRIVISSVVLLTAAGIAAGCGSDTGDNDKGSGKREVVVGFYPLGWLIEQMADDSIKVTNLTPPGAEPHDLELSAQDVAKVRSADAVLYIGGGFQPSLEAALEGADAEAIDVLKTPDLDLRKGVTEEGDGGENDATDPHVWLDPQRLALIARDLAKQLDLDPDETVAALDELDAEFRSGLANCKRSQVFTSHDAFGYLTGSYDLEQVAISGISPEAEPRPRDLERVAEQAREAEATTIYFETLVSPKLSETVASDVGAQTAVLDPIEGIATERQDKGEDYLSVMRDNLEALRAGLDCT